MEALFEQLRRLRLLPVVRLEEAAAALPLAEALAAGGLPARCFARKRGVFWKVFGVWNDRLI